MNKSNWQLDRRFVLKAGTFGIAALGLPGFAYSYQAQTGFTHGVASGEPQADSVLLWTRFVSTGTAQLTVELSETIDFSAVKAGGSISALAERDFIAKIVVSGLQPGRWYYYRFIAPDGSVSVTGRTRTLPVGDIDRFALGVFSCSNMPFGHFNAYAHAAERQDLDLILHLGDYLYEYAAGTYPSLDQAVPGRVIQPDHEMLTLADYRLRYASYRADRDLRRLHQNFPVISMWDDHEIANDSWKGGAQNHQAAEGDYFVRKKIAEQVYREWMPVRDRVSDQQSWSNYQIGTLASLMVTESRLTGRDQPAELAAAFAGAADIPATLAAFRDDVWQDPSRSMLGDVQSKWLADTMKASTSSGTHWQLWAQQCVMGSLKLPPETGNWISPDAPDFVRRRALAGLAAAQAGLPFNFDAWDGYPVARDGHLRAAQAADADLIVLSGDSHNGWAFDLSVDGQAAGVEFAGHSVTSPGFESFAPATPSKDIAAALMRSNDQLRWADSGSRGYMSVELTPQEAQSNWHSLATITKRSTAIAGTSTQRVQKGRNILS